MVQWYPGHMKKASDEIRDALQKVDVVIEILDARLPQSSSNPVLKKLRGEKPCIKVLNKCDLADPEMTKLWLRELGMEKQIRAVAIEAHKKKEVNRLVDLSWELAEDGLRRAVRTLVVGIPNVGKSTLINTLAGRKVAKVGNEPAVTRHQQQVRIKGGREGMDIMDTPGVLWPNLEDREGAYRLAASGAVKDTAMDYYEVATFGCSCLLELYPDLIRERYRIKNNPEKGEALLEEIGRRRGCLKKGGIIDLHKAAEIFLMDLRGGRIGRITLEKPGSGGDFEGRKK